MLPEPPFASKRTVHVPGAAALLFHNAFTVVSDCTGYSAPTPYRAPPISHASNSKPSGAVKPQAGS